MPEVWRRTRGLVNDELWHPLPVMVPTRTAATRSWSSAAAVLPPAARCPAGCLARCWRAWSWLPWSRWPSAASATRPGPPRRPRPRRLRCSVTLAGHRLLGVTAGWELFARGPNELLRIQLAQGRITQTYVPPLETASPDVAFVIGAHEAVIRPSDLVPGYVVPDGGQARPLTGVLSDGGPLVPGPVRLTGGLGCLGLAHLSGAVADHAHRAPVRTQHPVPVWRAAGACDGCFRWPRGRAGDRQQRLLRL